MTDRLGPGVSAQDVLATLEFNGREALDGPGALHLAALERKADGRIFWIVAAWEEDILCGSMVRIDDPTLVSQAVFELLQSGLADGKTHYHLQAWSLMPGDAAVLRDGIKMGVEAYARWLAETTS